MTTLEYRIRSTRDRYFPEFRKPGNPRWWIVRNQDGSLMDYATATAAKAAADQAVALENAKANPSYIHEEEPAADVLGVKEWPETKAARAVNEQIATFGTIWVRHKPVEVVERRKRRA